MQEMLMILSGMALETWQKPQKQSPVKGEKGDTGAAIFSGCCLEPVCAEEADFRLNSPQQRTY